MIFLLRNENKKHCHQAMEDSVCPSVCCTRHSRQCTVGSHLKTAQNSIPWSEIKNSIFFVRNPKNRFFHTESFPAGREVPGVSLVPAGDAPRPLRPPVTPLRPIVCEIDLSLHFFTAVKHQRSSCSVYHVTALSLIFIEIQGIHEETLCDWLVKRRFGPPKSKSFKLFWKVLK